MKIYLLLLLFPCFLLSQDTETMNLPKEHPFYLEFQELTKDIFVAIRPDASRQQVEGNTTVIINKKDVLVIDGGGAPIAAKQVIQTIKSKTDAPVRYLILTHGHGDHTGGCQEYVKAYPNLEILAHPGTKRYMDNGGLQYMADIATSTASRQRQEKEEIAEIEKANPKYKAEILANVNQYYFEDLAIRSAAYQNLEIIAPTATITDNLTLYREDREIHIFHAGYGKTASDIMVWLPKEKIMVAGDILTLPVPYGFSRNPDEWLKRLEELAAMDFEHLIPGHGTVQRDKIYLEKVIQLVKKVKQEVEIGLKKGHNEAEIFQNISIEKEKQAITGGDPVKDYLFQKWTLKPLVNRYGAVYKIK